MPDIKTSLISQKEGNFKNLSQSTTNSIGWFKFDNAADDESFDDLYIYIEYVYDKGDHTKLLIRNESNDIFYHDSKLKEHLDESNGGHVINGTVYFHSMECDAYIALRAALLDYENQTGFQYPAKVLNVMANNPESDRLKRFLVAYDTIK